MKITIVGFWGAYPERGEATSCYLIEHGGMKVVIDCGSGAVSQLQHYTELKDIDAVVLSHYHADHVADVGVLQYSRVVDQNLNRTSDTLLIYGHKEDEAAYARLTKKPFTEGLPYSEDEKLQLGEMTFSFKRTTHPVPCFAIRVEAGGRTLVYTADTSYQESLEEFCRGADLLIAETSFYKGQPAASYGHMNSEEVGKLAQASNVGKLVLSHLPHFGQRDELIHEASDVFEGEVTLARSGQVFEV